MATATLKKLPKEIGPEANGILMTPEEFDLAEVDECWRYELINGVLIVSRLPAVSEADACEQLGYFLRNYHNDHPQGSALDVTLGNWMVFYGNYRRWINRAIWAGLGRLPRKREKPTIVVDFVSARKRDLIRDYETKRDQFLEIGVKEYWLIDRFRRTMTVYLGADDRMAKRITHEHQSYKTKLLPGFQVPLARLFAQADQWPDDDDQDDLP